MPPPPPQMIYLHAGPRREKTVQFFYPLLQAHVHYWPVFSVPQILHATEWLLAHPAEAQRVGENAVSFVHEYLLPDKIDCVWLYYAHALARLRAAGVVVAPGAVAVAANATHRDLMRLVFGHNWTSVPLPTPGPTPTQWRTETPGPRSRR